MAGYLDAGSKTRHTVRMMHAARELAKVASDDFQRRTIARVALVQLQEFIRWAERMNKPLRRQTGIARDARALHQEIQALRKKDWEPYEPIRHQIGAHRHAFMDEASTSGLEQQMAASQHWAELDEVAVVVLTDDAAAIYNQVAALAGEPPVSTPLGIPPQLELDLRMGPLAADPGGLRVTAGSFEEENSVLASSSGVMPERMRQIVDACRSLDLMSQLALALRGTEILALAALSGAITDLCTLVELTYGRAHPTKHTATPMVDLLAAEKHPGAGLAALQAGKATFDRQAFEQVKQMRDKTHVHLDDKLGWRRIERALHAPMPSAFDCVLTNLADTLDRAVQEDIAFWPLKLKDARMSGVERVDPSSVAKPYSA